MWMIALTAYFLSLACAVVHAKILRSPHSEARILIGYMFALNVCFFAAATECDTQTCFEEVVYSISVFSGLLLLTTSMCLHAIHLSFEEEEEDEQESKV